MKRNIYRNYLFFELEQELKIENKISIQADFSANVVFLFTPKIKNYFKNDLSFHIYDYPYNDIEEYLKKYKILNTWVIHNKNEIIFKGPKSDLIIIIELSKNKLDDIDNESAQLFYKTTNVTNLESFDLLCELYDNDEKEIELKIISKFDLENEKGIIVYPVLNNQYDDYFLNKLLEPSKFFKSVF